VNETAVHEHYAPYAPVEILSVGGEEFMMASLSFEAIDGAVVLAVEESIMEKGQRCCSKEMTPVVRRCLLAQYRPSVSLVELATGQCTPQSPHLVHSRHFSCRHRYNMCSFCVRANSAPNTLNLKP
jgi:hypothetical protein